MNTILRFLGIMALSRLAARLPGALSLIATAALLILTNLLPVWAVATGRIGMGDVFLVYWIENVVVWACGIVRTATAEGTGRNTVHVSGQVRDVAAWSMAGFFALHYGIFTLVHGVFTIVVVVIVGLKGGLAGIVLLSAAITASHLFSLGVNWFGRGESKVVTPGRAMFAPYPRMLVLHIGIIIGFSVALDGWSNAQDLDDQTAAVAILCVMKLLVDLGFHVWQHWPRRVVPTIGLYGTASQE